MRKWACLEKPFEYNDELIYKVMIYQSGSDGVNVFLYDSPEGQICTADEWYENLNAAENEWTKRIIGGRWNEADDPLPDCQDDAIAPVRIKGRAEGKPEWGSFEMLKDGKWTEYKE